MTAREAALAALERCRRDKAWSGASIDNIIRKYSLDRREAALASRLCLGVLQNSTYCDYYIDLYYSKGCAKLEPKLLNILRLGVYQLLFLTKIPHSAAVNESVSLCKSSGYSRAAGLVNAVLRRVSENCDNLPEIPGKGSAQYLSIRYSHPLWLVERIMAQKGYEFTEGFLADNNDASPLTIQVNTLKVSVEDYVRSLERGDFKYRVFEDIPGCIELNGGVVTALPGFEDGLFYVQDRAARCAVQIAAPEPGMNILDACSAPGGKSFAAAIKMNNEGSILSCDIHEKKLSLIESGAEKLGIEIIKTKAADARCHGEELYGKFDVVVADVPCSGLGVIGKKPEIRYKTEMEVQNLPKIQIEIIESLSRLVKPGGILLYSTCTVLREENEDIVEAFLRENSGFEPVDFSLGDLHSENGMYTFWPNVNGTDGFFAAKLQRIK